MSERASSEAWMLTHDGARVRRELSDAILPGSPRAVVLELGQRLSLRVEGRAFSVEEAQGARECFVTSASSFVTPVVEIHGVPVADDLPGEVARKLR